MQGAKPRLFASLTPGMIPPVPTVLGFDVSRNLYVLKHSPSRSLLTAQKILRQNSVDIGKSYIIAFKKRSTAEQHRRIIARKNMDMSISDNLLKSNFEDALLLCEAADSRGLGHSETIVCKATLRQLRSLCKRTFLSIAMVPGRFAECPTDERLCYECKLIDVDADYKKQAFVLNERFFGP